MARGPRRIAVLEPPTIPVAAAAPEPVRYAVTFKVPRRSPDRVSQALVVLAPVAGPYAWKKHLRLVKGDTIVTVRSPYPVPAQELRRLYQAMWHWCSEIAIVETPGEEEPVLVLDLDEDV